MPQSLRLVETPHPLTPPLKGGENVFAKAIITLNYDPQISSFPGS